MYYLTEQDYLNYIFLLPLKVFEQLLFAAYSRHKWRKRDVM